MINGNHPNATVAALGAGVAALVAWFLRSHHWGDLNPEYGALIAGAVSAGLLFIGRRGLRGMFQGVWRGFGTIVNGTPNVKK